MGTKSGQLLLDQPLKLEKVLLHKGQPSLWHNRNNPHGSTCEDKSTEQSEDKSTEQSERDKPLLCFGNDHIGDAELRLDSVTCYREGSTLEQRLTK